MKEGTEQVVDDNKLEPSQLKQAKDTMKEIK